MSSIDDGPELEADPAIEAWGGDVSQLVVIKDGQAKVGHIPFYKFLYYPDVLDLRKCGYEVEAFHPLLDQLDNAHTSNAQIVHHLLHLPSDTYGRMGDGSGGNQIWNPRRARELEFTVRAATACPIIA